MGKSIGLDVEKTACLIMKHSQVSGGASRKYLYALRTANLYNECLNFYLGLT